MSILAAFLACLILSPAPAPAEESGSTGLLAADEEMVQKVLRVRTRDELTEELELAKGRERAALADIEELTQMATSTRGRVDIKKKEIDLVKERLRIAKTEGDAAQESALKHQLGREEAQLEVFVRMQAAAEGQLERARAALEFARARIRLQEAELRLVEKREAHSKLTSVPDDVKRQEDLAKLDREIRVMSHDVIAAIRDYSRVSERLAKATETLARGNLRLLEAWEDYSARHGARR